MLFDEIRKFLESGIEKVQVYNGSELEKVFRDILVANHDIENYDDVEDFRNDLEKANCIDGWYGSLIYYSETKEIFNNHFEEILEIYDELCEAYGEHLLGGELNYNNLVWLAFENYKYHIYSEIENIIESYEEF